MKPPAPGARGALWLLALVTLPAQAAAPLATLALEPRTPTATVFAGDRELGAGVSARAAERLWIGELAFSPSGLSLEARAGTEDVLWRWRALRLTSHGALALSAPLSGPFDAGAGVHGGLAFGIAWRWLEVGLLAQVGGEAWVRDPHLVAVLRLGALGAITAPVGGIPFRVGLYGRGGADLAQNSFPTARYEGGVSVAVAAP